MTTAAPALARVRPASRTRRRAGALAGTVAHLALVGFLLFWTLLPIVWLSVMSTQPERNYITAPINLRIEEFSLRWFEIMLGKTEFASAAVNSLIISTSTMLLSVTLGALAAYPLARLRMPLKRVYLAVIIASRLVPSMIFIVPMFLLARTLGLLDTHLILIVIYTALLLPFATWLLKNYFQQVPPDLERAARMDGCSRIGVLTRVIVPLSVPGIVATAVYIFIGAWNSFLFGLILTTREATPITLILSRQVGAGYQPDDPTISQLAAAGMLTVLPVLFLMLFLNRHIVRGLIDDVDVTEFAPHERGMVMVFQSYALYPHKNVYGNLAFSLQLAKVRRDEIERRVRAVAEMLEIGGLLDRRVGQLSGGQQQRVSLARALVKEPSVFLFDEPLSNLDAALRVRTRNEIKKLHQQLRTTSIFVTHDQEEAMVLSDLVAVMKDGLVEQLGTPDEIYHRPRSVEVAAFVGKPRINLLAAELRQANGDWSLVGEGLRVTADGAALRLPPSQTLGGPVQVGIRAEDVIVGWSESAGSGAPARVALVEPLGSDTFLELESGSSTLTARVAASVRPAVGDQASVMVRPEAIHLFDVQTGARLNN